MSFWNLKLRKTLLIDIPSIFIGKLGDTYSEKNPQVGFNPLNFICSM